MRITVLGLGLMGGSLWRKLAAEGHRVTGYDIDPDSRDEARRVASTTSNRHADFIADTIPAAVAAAELVVMCVPVPEAESLLHSIHESGYRGILTDVTSVKEPVQEIIDQRYPSTRWIGGHPMVGFERSGFVSSNVDMYDECPWVLCLDPESDSVTMLSDWLYLAGMLTDLGARVVPLTAAEHDAAVARISHVPHIVANAVTQTAASGEQGDPALTLGAGSFRDSTRVALTRTDRTSAFLSWNAEALTAELDQLIARLRRARKHLRSDNSGRELQQWLDIGHTVRVHWPPEEGEKVEFYATVENLLAHGRKGGWVTAVHGTTITGFLPKWRMTGAHSSHRAGA